MSNRSRKVSHANDSIEMKAKSHLHHHHQKPSLSNEGKKKIGVKKKKATSPPAPSPPSLSSPPSAPAHAVASPSSPSTSAAPPSSGASSLIDDQFLFGQAAEKVKKRKARRSQYCYLFLFSLFYGVFLAVVFMQRDVSNSYFIEAALRDIFVDEEFSASDAPNVRKSFQDIGEVSEFWEWTLGPFLSAMSDGNDIAQESQSLRPVILRYNRVLGAARIRQVRVRPDTCAVSAPLVNWTVGGCDSFFDSSTIDVEPYGPVAETLAMKAGDDELREAACAEHPAFCHREAFAPPVYGRVSDYESGGFFIDLQRNASEARAQLEELRRLDWIDGRTRMVVFTVNVFNEHMNLFVSLLHVVEFTPAGSFVLSWNYRSFRGSMYITDGDTLRAILEVAFLCMLLGWLALDVYQIVQAKRHGNSLLLWLIQPWWNFVDVVNKLWFLATTIWYVYFLVLLEQLLSDIDAAASADSALVQVEVLGYHWVQLFNFVAVNLLISTFAVFKFLTVNARISMMWSTLEQALADLVAFAIFFNIIFFSFVCVGYLLFGSQLSAWRTIWKAFFACFNMLLGQFDYEELEQNNRFIAPVFFSLFMVFLFLILVNVFIAIIQDAYIIVGKRFKGRPTLAVAGRRWLRKRLQAASEFFGKADYEEREAARAPVSNKEVCALLKRLEVRLAGGHDMELSREELINTFPDEPDAHIDYIYDLLCDPRRLDAVKSSTPGDNDNDDDEDNDDQNNLNAIGTDDPVTDLLKIVDTLEETVDRLKRKISSSDSAVVASLQYSVPTNTTQNEPVSNAGSRKVSQATMSPSATPRRGSRKVSLFEI